VNRHSFLQQIKMPSAGRQRFTRGDHFDLLEKRILLLSIFLFFYFFYIRLFIRLQVRVCACRALKSVQIFFATFDDCSAASFPVAIFEINDLK